MLIGKINSGNLGFKGIYDPNVLITGSSGYIGSHLVPKLADDGVNCIVCCRDKYKQEYLDTIIAEINRYKTDKSLCSFANFDKYSEAPAAPSPVAISDMPELILENPRCISVVPD